MLVSVWQLELRRPDALAPPSGPRPRVRLTPLLRPSPELARFLYTTVGADCAWRSRLAWEWHDWQRWLSRPEVEYWIGWTDAGAVGFSELNAGQDEGRTTTRIKYLGLLPEFRQDRLGGPLLTAVVRRAWSAHVRVAGLPRVSTVVADTSELDHDHALPNYQARGFTIADRTRVWRSRPRVPEPREGL